MIEQGYPGIEFGKYTEEAFLYMIPRRYVEFCKMITHRDTHSSGDVWRLQGTINSGDFSIYLLNNPDGLDNISIKRAGLKGVDFLITMTLPRYWWNDPSEVQ